MPDDSGKIAAAEQLCRAIEAQFFDRLGAKSVFIAVDLGGDEAARSFQSNPAIKDPAEQTQVILRGIDVLSTSIPLLTRVLSPGDADSEPLKPNGG